MSAAVLAGLALLGGVGAVARVVGVQEIGRHGLLAVNLAGAFTIGVVAGAGVHGDAYRLAVTGFLGGFTTFSTWMLDAEEQRHIPRIAVPLLGGLAAVWLGREIAELF